MITCPPHGQEPGYRESAVPPSDDCWFSDVSDAEIRAFVPAHYEELCRWRTHVTAFLSSGRTGKAGASLWAVSVATCAVIYERRLAARMKERTALEGTP
jgi:hypothetical protein